jgi:hypothetical protein
MDKVLYFLSALLFAASAGTFAFNVGLIRAAPDVTLATAANLMIFPGNLLFQSIVLLALGLVIGKLNRLVRPSRYSGYGPMDDSPSHRL